MWDVESQDDLIQTLSWLRLQGHAREYDRIKKKIAGLTDAEVQQLRVQLAEAKGPLREFDFVVANRDRLGEAGIIAWDIGRFANVCGWGYLAGYLDEKSAWIMLLTNARRAQRYFAGWEQFAMSYMSGREFWSSDENKNREIGTIIDSLLTDPNSPWALNPWNTRLQ